MANAVSIGFVVLLLVLNVAGNEDPGSRPAQETLHHDSWRGGSRLRRSGQVSVTNNRTVEIG